MGTLSTSEILDLYDSARFDPAARLRASIRRVNEIVDGNYQLVDPTNPLALLMEMACAGGAHACSHHEAEMRRRHPMLASTKEDLYYHLTDRQYVDAFAVPSETTVSMIIPIEDILQNAVEVGTTGVKKLVMGKNSIWRVTAYEFTTEYPIEFKITGEDGLTVGFGSPTVAPLHVLDSNLVESEIVHYQNIKSVRLTFPIRQMSVDNQIIRINQSSSKVGDITYTDKFHAIKAFRRVTENNARVWKPMTTTHTHHAYNPDDPTLLVRDVGGILKLTIPVIYHSMGMIGDDIRVDVYTTKAVNDLKLGELPEGSWTVEPRDFDNEDNGVYTAPFERMNTLLSFSGDYTRNGRDELSFEELKERITEVHYGDVDTPITTVNHQLKLKDQGFNSVKAVDGITSRAFNATRAMPLPTNNYLAAPISVGVFNALFRPVDFTNVSGIDINPSRVTIHPTVLFRDNGGSVSIVSDDERQMLAGMSGDVLARRVSESNYLFTPFYNVLDSTSDTFELRAYHLDDPVVDGRQFMLDNPSLLLDLLSSQGVTFERTATGYRLYLLTASGELYRGLRDDQVGVQLSYVPTGEHVPVALLGKLVSKDDTGNRVWLFDIITNHDIDGSDELQVLNFQSFNNGAQPNRLPLVTEFDLCHFVFEYPVQGMRKGNIDTIINQNIVPLDTYGILQERLKITLGARVQNLWTGARPIVLPEDYAYYDHDLLRYYTEPEWQRDAEGNLVLNMVNGKMTPVLKHAVGDVKLDDVTGQPEYVYRKGDVMMENGKPVIVDPRTLTRQIDLVLFDGLFAFANDPSSIDYVNYVRRNIVQWSGNNMAISNKTALENTLIKFRPISTIGQISAVVNEGGDVTIDARQKLTVRFLMTEMGWKNESLKKAVRKLAINIINAEFNKSSISVVRITGELSRSVPSDVLGIELFGLGGEDYNYPLLTLKDGSGQPAISMKLTALPDGTYTVEEDINFDFIAHLPARSDR